MQATELNAVRFVPEDSMLDATCPEDNTGGLAEMIIDFSVRHIKALKPLYEAVLIKKKQLILLKKKKYYNLFANI